jgi:hypothetical protein
MATLLLAAVALVALVGILSVTLTRADARRLTAEVAAMSDSLSVYADRLAGLTERLGPVAKALEQMGAVEEALREQEKQVTSLLERWSWPAPGPHPDGPHPLPPIEPDEPTPTAKPKKRTRR